MLPINEILAISAARHSHLCPRQVLGVRIGLAGAQTLGLETPSRDKCLLVISETDGCFADGIEAATGCSVGHRTLRVEDYGKIAATFVDVILGQAVRITPVLDVRERAIPYEPLEKRHYFAQLASYQTMPDAELLSIQEVYLNTPVEALIGRPGVRVNCAWCGEEIINGREIHQEGLTLCKACAWRAYYRVAPIEIPNPTFNLIPVTD
jgi:formylmethanofuran dehydrogenase subunit E